MGKVIKNPIEYKVIKSDGVVDVSAHYGLGCTECDNVTRKGISITLKPGTLADIEEEGMAQIEKHEGI